MKSREDQLRAQFKQYHYDHPEIWKYFKRFALEVVRSGHNHYSARAIFHRIRWHVNIERREEDEFKINNNYSPFYVELFEDVFPQHAGFFRTRERLSKYTAPR